jgi:hypothetical protein
MRVERLALVCCAWAALCACSDAAHYRELSFTQASDPPMPVQLDADHVDLVEGVAVSARVSAIDTEGKPMPVLTFKSGDPHVFGVARGPELGHWVFFGVARGKAQLEVDSDGHAVARLPVTVAAQTDTPRDAGTR